MSLKDECARRGMRKERRRQKVSCIICSLFTGKTAENPIARQSVIRQAERTKGKGISGCKSAALILLSRRHQRTEWTQRVNCTSAGRTFARKRED